MFFILANFHIFQPEKYDFNTEKGFLWEKKMALVQKIERGRGGARWGKLPNFYNRFQQVVKI